MDISEGIFIANLGTHIRQLREKRLITARFSWWLRYQKTQIGRIERAEINTTVKTLVKIANALDIEPKELFDFPSK